MKGHLGQTARRAEIDPNFTRENLLQRPAFFMNYFDILATRKWREFSKCHVLKMARISGLVNTCCMLDNTLTMAPIISLCSVESESSPIFFSKLTFSQHEAIEWGTLSVSISGKKSVCDKWRIDLYFQSGGDILFYCILLQYKFSDFLLV